MDDSELRSALRTLREQQERSLLSIEAFLLKIDQQDAFEGKNSPSIVSETFDSPVQQLSTGTEVEDNGPSRASRSESFRKRSGGAGRSFSAMARSKFREFLHGSVENLDVDRDCGSLCKWLVSRPQFDWFMGIIIFANSVCIGIETQRSISADMPGWPAEAIDWSFMSIYIIEIILRSIAYGSSNFYDGWFLFDLLLVGLGLTGNIFQLVMSQTGETFGQILVLRSLRLLRLVRAIRMLHVFRTCWRLVYGLLTSGNAMMSTFFILLLTLYIFACLGVELITKSEVLREHPDTAAIVEYHFGSLPRTLMTMLAFVSSDSISAVYAPLCMVRPPLIIFFILVILTVSVSLMNLVTAILVEGALANAANDKELSRHDLKAKVKKFAPKIMDVFEDIDRDGNGIIDREELSKIKLSQLPVELGETYVSNLEDLFDMLDVEGKGQLTLVEFSDGLLNLLTMDVPLHTMKIFKLLHIQSVALEQIKVRLNVLDGKSRCETF